MIQGEDIEVAESFLFFTQDAAATLHAVGRTGEANHENYVRAVVLKVVVGGHQPRENNYYVGVPKVFLSNKEFDDLMMTLSMPAERLHSCLRLLDPRIVMKSLFTL